MKEEHFFRTHQSFGFRHCLLFCDTTHIDCCQEWMKASPARWHPYTYEPRVVSVRDSVSRAREKALASLARLGSARSGRAPHVVSYTRATLALLNASRSRIAKAYIFSFKMLNVRTLEIVREALPLVVLVNSIGTP